MHLATLPWRYSLHHYPDQGAAATHVCASCTSPHICDTGSPMSTQSQASSIKSQGPACSQAGPSGCLSVLERDCATTRTQEQGLGFNVNTLFSLKGQLLTHGFWC